MVSGISGTTSPATPQQVQATQAVAQATPVQAAGTAATTTHRGDTVKLSKTAQAHLLHRQGHSLQDISSKLSIDTKTLANYFK